MGSNFVSIFVALLHLLAQTFLDPNQLPKMSNSSIHPLVDSTVYAWNTAAMFGTAMLAFIMGATLWYFPKRVWPLYLDPYRILFTWWSIWLIAEGMARMDYTMLLLNMDRLVPILYPLLPILRGLTLIIGYITFLGTASYFIGDDKYGRTPKNNNSKIPS